MKRSGAAAVVVVSAALVAAGCGSDSDAGSAAKDAKALDFIPKTALGYVTVDLDLDLEGDSWKQFDKLAGAFTDDFDLEKEIADLGDEDDKTDYKKDIAPWLGESAGAAVTTIDKNGDNAEAFVWIELEDRAKFEDYAKDEGFKKDGTAGDFDLWTKKDDTFAVSDDLAITGETKAQVTKVVEFDGDSINDVDGLDGVIDDLDGDSSLATIVVNGDGVRDWIKKDEDLKALANNKQLKEFDGAAVSFAAEDKGFRLSGVSKGGTEGSSNGGTDVLRGLPGNTVVALGGNDLGGGIKSALDAAGESDASVQSAVAQLSGVIGVEVSELETAFDGEFVLGISGEDDGLQALVGTAAGAAMGGGVQGVDPATLTKAGAITLAFEANDDTAATLDKIAGAVGGLTGGGAPKAGTAGDFETKTMNLGGLPITAASKDDVAAISVGTDVFTDWGSDSLGDNEAFKDAWAAAGAPDDVAVSFWADFPRVAKLAELKSKDGVTAGGWVGWGESDGGDASFDLFMHVKES